MEFPANETETIMIYKLAQSRLGWHIKHLQTAFPDALIENRSGKVLVIEFEYLAGNFRIHGHDPSGCDLIICWRNNWPNAPLPVWTLEEIANEEARILQDLISPLRSRNAWLRGQAEILKRALHHATLENAVLRERLGMATYAIEEINQVSL